MPGDVDEPAGTVRFAVQIDGWNLGLFTGCKGLGCTLSLDTHDEGGNQGFQHHLPGRMTFTNVVLTRPIDSSTGIVAQWIGQMAHHPRRTTGSITVLSLAGAPVAAWGLVDVLPVKWTGPDLDSTAEDKLATETLELAHHGFTDPGRPG